MVAGSFERREELRNTFDQAASVYDDGRPPYPAELFDDLLTAANVSAGARLLEIGSGSGIATRALAERGFAVVGIELSSKMAARARSNLKAVPSVSIVTGSFEEFTSPTLFDGVVAFSAFHWLLPGARCIRASELLRPGGFLAVADARWSFDLEEEFAVAFDRDCRSVLGNEAERGGAPALTPLASELENAGFTHLLERRYSWEVSYSAQGFIALLSSLPWYLALPPDQRQQIFTLTEARINARHHASVTTTFKAILDLAGTSISF